MFFFKSHESSANSNAGRQNKNESVSKYINEPVAQDDIPKGLFEQLTLQFVLKVAQGEKPSAEGMNIAVRAFQIAHEMASESRLVSRLNYLFGLSRSDIRVFLPPVDGCKNGFAVMLIDQNADIRKRGQLFVFDVPNTARAH